MNPQPSKRTATREADQENLETLSAAATIFDQLNPGPHTHAWTPRAGQDRLVGDVWRHPYECACGSTAWKETFSGKTQFVDIQQPPPAVLLQNDAWHTPLPNGMLRWFGFDFDRAELPDEPLLRGGASVQWIGVGHRFLHKTSISDAQVTIEVDEFQTNDETREEITVSVIPKRYHIRIEAHAIDHAEVSHHHTWAEVQEQCRDAEQSLEESWTQRHSRCQDETGDTTADACQFCSTS